MIDFKYQSIVIVLVGLTVTKQGAIKDITIEYGSSASVNEQTIKLFKSFPVFNPASIFNRKIDYHFVQRIEFRR